MLLLKSVQFIELVRINLIYRKYFVGADVILDFLIFFISNLSLLLFDTSGMIPNQCTSIYKFLIINAFAITLLSIVYNSKNGKLEIIEGHRKDSIVYRHGPYTFRKDNDSHGVIYLRCVRYSDGCSARAIINLIQIRFLSLESTKVTSQQKRKLK